MRFKKFIVLLSVLSILLTMFGCNASETKTATIGTTAVFTPVTFTDDAGHEITLDKQVTRVAVSNRYNLELIRACGYIDRVVGVDDSIIEN